MPTRRITVNVSSPITEFDMDVDLISQDQAGNFSTVYYWLGAVNRGNTSSYNANNGSQIGYVAGGGGGAHTGTLPSGVGAGGQRWYDGPWGINLGHDANGYRNADQVQQTLTWSVWNRSDYGSIGPYPRIPKRPSPPGTPVASKIMPTSLQLDWAASGDNGGSGIDVYLVRRWAGSSPTGSYVDISQNGTITRNDTGLTPGTTYTYGVYAHNGSADNSGYSLLSGTVTVKTIAPMRVRVSGVWKYAVPYLKIAGAWKMMQPYVKKAGVWKATG